MLYPLYSHEYFMQQALLEAEKAFSIDEIPVGAVVVVENQIIAKAHNQTEQLQDVTAHAELLAITASAHYLGAKYLTQCTMYVTLEPCVMCAGAIFWAQFKELVWGASDEKRGFAQWKPSLIHPKTKITSDILAAESKKLLQNFFQNLRN